MLRHRTWRASRALRRLAVACTAVAVVGGLLTLAAPGAQAYPLRTHVPWAVLLCQFSDSPAPAQTPAYYSESANTVTLAALNHPEAPGTMLVRIPFDLYQSYLIRNHTGNRDPVTFLSANGVRISVNWINAATHQASVSVQGDIADRCLQGYVWREAAPSDHVCVTRATRTQAAADNGAAASHVAHA